MVRVNRDDIPISLLFSASTRETHFQEHSKCSKEMIAWMAAYDCINYTPYGSVYIMWYGYAQHDHPS